MLALLHTMVCGVLGRRSYRICVEEVGGGRERERQCSVHQLIRDQLTDGFVAMISDCDHMVMIDVLLRAVLLVVRSFETTSSQNVIHAVWYSGI
jgi:hypothetical protein